MSIQTPHAAEISVTLEQPSHHGRTQFTIRPGVVDADAIELFGYAKCHLLAAAMHEQTGWPIAKVDQYIDGEWKWAHAGVLTPCGQVLDIHGTRRIDEVTSHLRRNFGPQARVTPVTTLDAFIAAVAPGREVGPWTDQANPLAVEVVRRFAEVLVAEVSA